MRRDDWLLHQLPVGMTDDDHLGVDDGQSFFVRFVSLFQEMADTVIMQVDTVSHMFDPTVAPDNMVRLMAAWFGVDWVDSELDERMQRKIVMEYSDLIAWRGTRRGLTALLKLLTDGPVEVRDTGGVFAADETPDDAAHVRIDVRSLGWNEPYDFMRIVSDELPATVTFEIWVNGTRLMPDEIEREATTGWMPIPAGQRDEELNDA